LGTLRQIGLETFHAICLGLDVRDITKNKTDFLQDTYIYFSVYKIVYDVINA